MRQRDAVSLRPSSLFDRGGNQESLGLLDRITPRTTPRTAALGNLAVQRKCAKCESEEENDIQHATATASAPPASETEAAVEDAAAVPLIVDDESAHPGPEQMRKRDFLETLRAEVCTAVDEEAAATGRSSKGCPHVEFWFARAADKPAAHVERALRKFAPETVGAESAADYVPIVVARVRRSVRIWAETGEITGAPEDLPQALGGSGSDETEPGAAGGANADVAFEAQAGGAGQAGSPAAVRDRLGPGRSLDAGVRSRMETAFGMPFGDVRIHTDAPGARLSHTLNARAFTVGTHVAFDAGEYRPGTVPGDALLAHELAHVVQQRAGDQRLAQGAKPGAAGAQRQPENRALEEDADRSAAHALAQGVGDQRRGLASRMWQGLRTRAAGGLRLQRCGRERCPPGEAFYPKAGMGIGNLGPGVCRWECFPIPPEERVAQSGPSMGKAPERSVFDYEPTSVKTSAFFNANTGTCMCSPPKDPETGEPLREGAIIDCASVGIPTARGKGGAGKGTGGAGRARPRGRGAAGVGTGSGKGGTPKKGGGKGSGKGSGTSKKGAAKAGDDFLKTATHQELVDFVGGADTLRTISKKLHAAFPTDIAREQRVVAVGVVREGPGHPPRLACAVSANRVKDIQAEADKLGVTVWSISDSALRATGRASKKTPNVPGAPGDAEQRLIEAANQNGMKVIAVVPSKAACADCVSAIQAEGALLIDPAP